ncbi:hypothetical protein BDZ88DRAFT_22512 [Geranomyces variabilis]|nr:hypothetical protein BDZ88DRAFT_22512 [Geranomyces variabilis]
MYCISKRLKVLLKGDFLTFVRGLYTLKALAHLSPFLCKSKPVSVSFSPVIPSRPAFRHSRRRVLASRCCSRAFSMQQKRRSQRSSTQSIYSHDDGSLQLFNSTATNRPLLTILTLNRVSLLPIGERIKESTTNNHDRSIFFNRSSLMICRPSDASLVTDWAGASRNSRSRALQPLILSLVTLTQSSLVCKRANTPGPPLCSTKASSVSSAPITPMMSTLHVDALEAPGFCKMLSSFVACD